MKRSIRPVPIQVPQGDTAAGFKLTDSGVWSEGGIILSTAGCIIDKCRLREDSQRRPVVVAECPQHVGAPVQDDCSSNHIDQPVSEASNCCTDAVQDGTSSASSSSRSHAGSSTGVQPHNSLPAGSASSSSNTSSPSSSTIALTDLQELAVIGSGSSGVVKKVLHRPTQQVYVLKVINLDMGSQQVRRQVTREVRALDGARHPHVVSYHQSFFAEGAVTILMEFMDGGTLWDLLQKIRIVPEPYLAELTRQMLLGLSFLHDTARICHRDVKPSNLLLSSSGQLKISDFGTSSQLSNSMSKCLSWVGTVTYMSPERIRGDSYTFNTDVWSLGLLVLECALGRYPYPPQGTSEGGAAAAPAKLGFWELLEYIVVEPVPRLPAGQFSAELVDFVAQCLQKDAARRPSASQLLLHPFVSHSGSSKVNLADLLKLPPRQQQQQHGSNVNGSSAAGRNGSGLRRSGNYGGFRGGSLGGAPGGSLLRQSSGALAGMRGSWSAAGKAGTTTIQQQGSIMGELPGRQAAAPSAAAVANTAPLVSAASHGQCNNSSSNSNASPLVGNAALTKSDKATEAAAAAGVAGETAGSPASPQPVATTSPPAPKAPGALTAAAASGALTPAMAAAAAAALRESSPLLSGQLMRQSAMGTLAGRPAGLAAAHLGSKASMLQQHHGVYRQSVQAEQMRQSVLQQQQQQQVPRASALQQQQQQAPRVSGLQPQQQPQPCGPLQQQQHQQWLAGLAAQQVHQASVRQQVPGLHPHPARQQQPAQQALQHAQGPLAQQLAGMHLHQHHQQLQQQQHSKAGSPNAATRAAGPGADHKPGPAVGRMMTPEKQLGSASSSGHGSPVVGQGPLTTLKPSTSRRLPDGPAL